MERGVFQARQSRPVLHFELHFDLVKKSVTEPKQEEWETDPKN